MNTRSYHRNNQGADTQPSTMHGDSGADAAKAAALTSQAGVWWSSIAFAGVFIALCGLVYPVITTFAGGALFPHAAEGSLIRQGDRIVGSSLVAQPFAGAGYFTPRPSSSKYDPMSMAGSNMAPSNPELRKLIAARATEVGKREGVDPMTVPADLVTASGSSIDPHISPAAAQLQVARVAKARGMNAADVEHMVAANTAGQTFGVLGQARVNVLELNLALDAAQKR
jgi:potassium-transporting ATPase KdpC subunit